MAECLSPELYESSFHLPIRYLKRYKAELIRGETGSISLELVKTKVKSSLMFIASGFVF